MFTQERRSDIERICSCVLWDEPMSRHTTFKIGGPAECFASPGSAESFIALIDYCDSCHIPFYLVGNGSNLLVSDAGVEGVVIHAGKNYSRIFLWDGRPSFLKCEIPLPGLLEGKTVIAAESGALLCALSAFALKQSLCGMEFASGIPGSVGGGLIMNAGAYDGEIANVCAGSLVYDTDKKQIRFLTAAEQEFSYRSSIYQRKNYIVLMGFFALESGDPSLIREKIDGFTARRKAKQPIDMPSAGSTFKRPQGAYAAQLIESCGLKGASVGDAQVSPKHSGFIVNTGHASCENVLELMSLVQKTVREQSGFELTPEVRIIR